MPEMGFARTYGVQLFFESKPQISRQALCEAVQRRCPGAEPMDPKPGSDLLGFVHRDHLVEYKDGTMPAQTVIAIPEQGPDAKVPEAALQQSWRFPGAREAVARATSSIIVTDFLASGLEPQERISLFMRVLASILEVLPCTAIHWQASGQVTDPQDFLALFAESEETALMAGPINVRMFKITGAPGEMVMDTLGLAALGLPDLQCHFQGLNPNQVAGVLYNLGLYILEQGDVIDDGHTVQGITATDKWRCQHEDALVGPERVVLDLNPGGR